MTTKRKKDTPTKVVLLKKRRVAKKQVGALSSTARGEEHIKRVFKDGGQRFVVTLRGGAECDAVQKLFESGYGKTRLDVVRRALVEVAEALEKRTTR